MRSNDYIGAFDKLLPLVERLTDYVHSSVPLHDGNLWKNDGQVLAIKFFRHLATIRAVYNGAEGFAAADGSRAYVDHSSVKVLARASLEAYLTLHYVFCAQDEGVRVYRHTAWVLGGLCDRQEFYALSERMDAKKAAELVKINHLRTLLPLCADFQKLTSKQKDKVLQGDWRMPKSWADLAKEAEIPERLFRDMYGHLCNYAHSSYLAVLQVRDAHTESQDRKMAEFAMGIGVFLMACFVRSYLLLFPSATVVLESDPAAAGLARLWLGVVRSMDGAYDRPDKV